MIYYLQQHLENSLGRIPSAKSKGPHCPILTNAVFFHESNEICFCEEQGRTGFPIHHLHRGGLKARPFLIQWDNLKGSTISLKLLPGPFTQDKGSE